MNPQVITYTRIQLSEEERRILHMLAVEGYTQDRVALEISKSRETVKRYCRKIRETIGVESLYQAVAVAVALGWITAPRAGKRVQ
jgi:DNA-binding NarL/FixJ family response regulator